jgi:hypothetical protein
MRFKLVVCVFAAVFLFACLEETEGMDEQSLSTIGTISSRPSSQTQSQVNTGTTANGCMAGKERRRLEANLNRRRDTHDSIIFVDSFKTM